MILTKVLAWSCLTLFVGLCVTGWILRNSLIENGEQAQKITDYEAAAVQYEKVIGEHNKTIDSWRRLVDEKTKAIEADQERQVVLQDEILKIRNESDAAQANFAAYRRKHQNDLAHCGNRVVDDAVSDRLCLAAGMQTADCRTSR